MRPRRSASSGGRAAVPAVSVMLDYTLRWRSPVQHRVTASGAVVARRGGNAVKNGFALMTIFTTCLAVLATYGVAAATISSMQYIESYTPTQTVKVWRGENADIVVKGTFLDLSTA